MGLHAGEDNGDTQPDDTSAIPFSTSTLSQEVGTQGYLQLSVITVFQ